MNKSQIRFCYGSTCSMACDEKPSINTRVYGAMGEAPSTTIVRGGRRTVAVWVCVSGDVQGSMSKATRERNQSIRQEFYQLYGTMPIMLLYATLGNKHEVSEHTIRSILNNRWK